MQISNVGKATASLAPKGATTSRVKEQFCNAVVPQNKESSKDKVLRWLKQSDQLLLNNFSTAHLTERFLKSL